MYMYTCSLCRKTRRVESARRQEADVETMSEKDEQLDIGLEQKNRMDGRMNE